MKSSDRRRTPPENRLGPQLKAALLLLLRGWELASKGRRDMWELAVEIAELRKVGLTTVDLHWLLSKGYVQHAIEETKPGSAHRQFGVVGRAQFHERSCFVLTKTGARLARRLESTAHSQSSLVPYYDIGRGQLWVGGVLVKHFKQNAPEQHKILSAFQRRGWPTRIVNPLTRRPGDAAAKIHLGEVIKRLNRCQRNALIRFHGAGNGRGITWEIVTPS
jgi:hypothetical protein